MTALAMCECVTEKFSKTLRSMYEVPEVISRNLHTWIALPKQTKKSMYSLFQKRYQMTHKMIVPATCEISGYSIDVILSQKGKVVQIGSSYNSSELLEKMLELYFRPVMPLCY